MASAPRTVCGQARYVPSKRTALDGKVWWCLFDRLRGEYLPGMRSRTRTDAVLWLELAFRRGELPYVPEVDGTERSNDARRDG